MDRNGIQDRIEHVNGVDGGFTFGKLDEEDVVFTASFSQIPEIVGFSRRNSPASVADIDDAIWVDLVSFNGKGSFIGVVMVFKSG